MNDLHTWLSQQHHGLRTFRTFQQKLNDLVSRRSRATRPVPAAEWLSSAATSIPSMRNLAVAAADRAYQRLLEMVASLDFDGSADRRPADINRGRRRWICVTRL